MSIFLVSCTKIDGTQPVAQYDDHGKITSVHKFTYEDHDYLDFEYNTEGGETKSISVLHNPECRKCNVNENSFESLLDKYN